MAIREYVGARYVPKFMGVWSNTTEYEPLSIVDDGLGTSYTSKVQVPPGTPLNDTDYWAVTGSTSGAIVSLQNRVTALENDIVPIVNVQFTTPQQFGAAGDGLTDDTQAFQDAAATGKSIYIPEGSYVLSGKIELESNTRIFGLGELIDNYVLVAPEDKEGLLHISSKENIIIEGITIKGQGATSGNYTLGSEIYAINSKNIVIRDVQITDVLKCYTICAETCDNVLVDNCQMVHLTHSGVTGLNTTDNLTVQNCRIVDVTGLIGNTYPIMLNGYDYPISSPVTVGKNLKAINNYIDVVTPHWEGIDAHGGNGIVITGNVVKNPYTAVAIASQPNYTANDVLIADNVLVGATSGTSINQNNAAIAVAHGTDIIISDNICENFCRLTSMQPVGAIFINACDGVEIHGNRITGCVNTQSLSGYFTDSKNINVHGNTCLNNGNYRAFRWLGACDGIHIHDNLVRNCGILAQFATTESAPYDSRVWSNDTDNQDCSGSFAQVVPQANTIITPVKAGKVGDIVNQFTPAVGSPIGWICVQAQTAGTDAVWAQMPNISNIS